MTSVNAGASYSVSKIGKFSITGSISGTKTGESKDISKDYNVSFGYSAPLDISNVALYTVINYKTCKNKICRVQLKNTKKIVEIITVNKKPKSQNFRLFVIYYFLDKVS